MNLGFAVLAVVAGNQLVIRTYTVTDGFFAREPVERSLNSFLGPERQIQARLSHLNRTKTFDGKRPLACRLMLSPSKRFLFVEQVEKASGVENGLLDLIEGRATFLPWKAGEWPLELRGEQKCELVTVLRSPFDSAYGRELVVREIDPKSGHEVRTRGAAWVSINRETYEARTKELVNSLKKVRAVEAYSYGDFRTASFGYVSPNSCYLSHDGSTSVVWYRDYGVSVKHPPIHIGVALHSEGWKLRSMGEWEDVDYTERHGDYIFVLGWRTFPGPMTLTVVRHTDGRVIAEVPSVGFAVAGLTSDSEYLRMSG